METVAKIGYGHPPEARDPETDETPSATLLSEEADEGGCGCGSQ